MSRVLLLGDSRVRDVRSPQFSTMCLPGATLSRILKKIKTVPLGDFDFIIVAAGINDLSSAVGTNSILENRSLFLKLKDLFYTIFNVCPQKIIIATLMPKLLKAEASVFRYKRHCHHHPSAISDEMQSRFEWFVDSINENIINDINLIGGVHCPFHLDCRLNSGGRRRVGILYNRFATDGLHLGGELTSRWIRRVEKIVIRY